jgi:hypothetical protein
MLLITTFVELRLVAGRSRSRAGHTHAVSGRPMLIHTCHATPMLRCAVALRGRFENDMVVAWHGRDMVYANKTRSYCVNQMGKTQSKALVEWHGKGTAWYVWIGLKRAMRISWPWRWRHYNALKRHYLPYVKAYHVTRLDSSPSTYVTYSPAYKEKDV